MIPVVWASNHADVLARGTWDQGMLEALFDGSLWRVPGAPTFEHYEFRGDGNRVTVHINADPGLVLIVSGRNHTSAVDLAWINGVLRRFAWCFLIVTGDEEGTFPYDELDEHPRLAVWGMGTKEPHPRVDWPLGSGWPPWFRKHLPEEPPDKPLDFVFAGQVTHSRRQEAADQMALWSRPCQVLETAGFTQGLPPNQYAHLMCDAKVAPCPSGPESPDSFRVYEALEAGCIPFADAATPHGPERGYWTHVLGEPPPFPEIHDWAVFPRLMRDELKHWPANANKVGAWWSLWKRDLAWRFIRTLRAEAGEPRELTAEQEISVIVPTSPSPLHPSTEHLDATIASVRAQLPDSEIIVALDPPRPELKERRKDWDEFVRRVVWKAHHQWSNVATFLRPEWGHEANVTADALELVRTPLMLLVEYDAPLTDRPIDWAGCAAAIHSGQANMIRFLHESKILPEWEHLTVGPEETICGVPLVPTMQYSSRPHLAPVWLYRDIFERWFRPEARTMIEDPLYAIIQREGPGAWERWRIWVYADTRPDGSMQRSLHLDGRQTDEKYEMRY